jgi:pyridoxamine 5'-phosphate oxidase-like protein
VSTTFPLDIEAFLAEPLRPAQVASVNQSGTPILGSFWFLFAEGRFWFSSRPRTPLAMAVTSGAEAAVIVDEFSPPENIRQVRLRGHGGLEPHDPKRV